MATNPRAAAFALRFRKAMSDAGFTSNRGFGKVIDPQDPVRGRRNVLRHRSGKHMPSAAMVRVYAAALDVPARELDPAVDDTDEEAALSRDLTEQVRELKRALSSLERSVNARSVA